MSPFDPPPVRPLKPGVAGYWIGGGLILIGIVGAIVWLVFGLMRITSAIDEFERVPADGGGTITLDDDRPYVVYIEDGSTSRFATDVRLAVVDPSGDEVDLRRVRDRLQLRLRRSLRSSVLHVPFRRGR